MPNWWEYSDETEYRKRQADDLVRRYSAPAAQPSRPLVSFLDTQGKVTPGSVLSGALDVLQVPTEVIGKPLLGAITEAVTPGRQIHVDPNAPWYEQARQWYEGAKRAEEQRPELFGFDIPESVPLVGGTHIGEKFITENILFDPLNWLGWGGAGLLKAAPALAKAGQAAGLLSDVGKATDVLQGVGRAGRAIDIATTPLAWPDVAARAAAKAGKPGLALAARGAQAGAYLASAPALAAAAPWMLVEPALRKAGGALFEGLGRAPGKVAAEAARAGGLGRLVAQEAGEVELPGRVPDLRPDEGIIARSAPRESYTEGVDEFFFEWRVRPATEEERVNYRVPYEDAAILERRRVDVRQGEAQPREWEIADAAKSAEELIRGYGSTDLMGAESLSPMLTEWQERSGRINELQQQLAELEGEIKPGLYERSPLYDKWQSEYKAELKRKRLYSAAKQNKAPAKQIQPIQQKYRRRYEEELGQIERRIEELRQQLSELQSQRLRAPLWQREVEAPRPEAPAREPDLRPAPPEPPRPAKGVGEAQVTREDAIRARSVLDAWRERLPEADDIARNVRQVEQRGQAVNQATTRISKPLWKRAVKTGLLVQEGGRWQLASDYREALTTVNAAIDAGITLRAERVPAPAPAAPAPEPPRVEEAPPAVPAGPRVRVEGMDGYHYGTIIGGPDTRPGYKGMYRIRFDNGEVRLMYPRHFERVEAEAAPVQPAPPRVEPAPAAPPPLQPDFLTAEQRRPVFGTKRYGGRDARPADLLGRGLAENPEAQRAQMEAAGQVPMFGAQPAPRPGPLAPVGPPAPRLEMPGRPDLSDPLAREWMARQGAPALPEGEAPRPLALPEPVQRLAQGVSGPTEADLLRDIEEARAEYQRALDAGDQEYADSIRPIIEAAEQQLYEERAMNGALQRITGKAPEQATRADWQRVAEALEDEVNDLQMRYTREGIEGTVQFERGGKPEPMYAFGKEIMGTRGRMSRAETQRRSAEHWQRAQADVHARLGHLLKQAGYTEEDIAKANLQQRQRLLEEVSQGRVKTTKSGKPSKIDEVPWEKRAAVVPQVDEDVRDVAGLAAQSPLDAPGLNATHLWELSRYVRAQKLGEDVGDLPPLSRAMDMPRPEPPGEIPMPEPPGVEAVPVQAEPRPVQAPAPEAVSAEAPEPMRAQPPQPPQEPPRVPPAGEEAPRPEEMPEEIGLQLELVRQSWQAQKKVQASLGENARRWWKTGWREFVDRLDALKQLSKDGNTDAYVDARLVSGAVGRGQSLILQHVMPVLKKVDAHLDDFKDYLVATRMVDIKAKRPKSKLPGGVSDPARALEEIRTRLGEETYKLIEDTAAEFRQRMDEITIKQALAVGRINSAQATAMRKMYPHYIPFYRQDFDTVGEWARASTMKAAHAPTEFSKRMKEEGSKRAIKDPLTSAFAAAINEQILIARHVAATSTIEALRNIDPKLARKGDFSKGRPELGIIQKRENGKLVTYTVPVEIARAAKATDAYGAGLLGQILRKPADILRKGATVYNPTFPARNVLRDMFSAYWTEGLIPFTKYWWQGMAASFTRNDDWHRAAQAMGFSGSLFRGGLTGDSAQHAATLGAIPLKSFKDMVLVVPRTLERLNEALEQGTRNAVFLKAIAEGATDKQAAFRMRNCTLDFDMSGYATRVLNQAIPFLNPRIQGTATFFRVAKENPKLAFSRAAPLAVPLVLFWLWNQRFKDTAGMIPDYEYQANWVFQVGEGTQEPDPRYPDQPPQKFPIYFKIPKGEAVAALTAIPQAILRAAWAVDDRSAVELVLNAAYQGALGMSPIEPELSSLTTPVLGTALQMGINKDLYRGLNIVPQGELGRPPEEQYGPETSRVAVALGQAFGVSPRMIDFAIGDVTAGAGKSTVWLADLALGALGYNPAVPGAAARQQLTGVEQLAKAPVTGGMLGARANQQERIAYQKLDRAIEAARRQLYRNPEVKRFGMGINPPGDTYTVDGVPRPITPEQRAEIVQRSTPLVAAALDELVGREFYQGAADTEKRKLLDRVRQEVQGNVREAVLGLARPWDEDTARLFVQALEEKREYDAIPPYIGLTPEQAERGRATRTAMTNLARQNPLVSPAYIESIYRMTDPTGYALSKRLRTNPARRAYWLSHPLLRQFFGGEAPEAAQQMLAAMYPTQGAQAQAYGGLYG